jgi:hypothetical protein
MTVEDYEKLTTLIDADQLEADIRKAAALLGRKGGSAKSARKTAAVRENGRKGGRPRTGRRYRVYATLPNRATITADLWLTRDGEPETREFWAPSLGGYVYHITAERPGTLGAQVCALMGDAGMTLMWEPGRGPLADLLRKHLRLAYAHERRALTE